MKPEKRLAHNLTVGYEAAGEPSWRYLEDQVTAVVGPDRKVSYETLRKLHEGSVPWRAVRSDIVETLAYIYHVKLEDLSPELAASTPPGTRTRNLQIAAA